MTKFGKLLVDLRRQRYEILGDMADRLGVSPAYLSGIEHGKRPVPPEWPEQIGQLYRLSREQIQELQQAKEEDVPWRGSESRISRY